MAMNPQDFDVVVIGGGCIGASILFTLHRRGMKNLALVDSGRKNLSATAHSGGLLRIFHESSAHVDLALGHLNRMETLRKTENLLAPLQRNGSLYFFSKKRLGNYCPLFEKMQRNYYPFEVITTDEGRKRFPDFRWSDDDLAVYEPLAGSMNPVEFSQNLLDHCLDDKIPIFEDVEINSVVPIKGGFLLNAAAVKIRAARVVFAGGAQMLPLLKIYGLPVELTAQELTTYSAKKTSSFNAPNYFDRESLEFASLGQETLVTLSHPRPTRLTLKNWNSDYTVKRAFDCYTPQRKGFVGRVPGHEGIFIATGWGGTAFKFSLEIANQVARSIETHSYERLVAHV